MISMTREYKNSDIEWYDSIPFSWKKVKIGWLFNLIASGTTPPSNNNIYYDGGIPWLNTGDLKDGEIESTTKTITEEAIKEYSTLKLYPKGSLVMAMYGATIGKLGITKFETTTNQACCVMAQPINTNSKFIFYWLMGNRKEIINLSQGGGQPNINQNIIKNLKLYLPNHDEQQAIANFLDDKTSEIDSLIADKEKLIELLEEKRQAIITEAVTKGLNPNVKMKDSGVEWIGEIPEHWEINRIKKSVVSANNGVWGDEPQNDEDDISCIRVADFNRRTFEVADIEYTMRNLPKMKQKQYLLEKDDLLIEKSGGGEKQPVGFVVLYPFENPAIYANFMAKIMLNKEYILPGYSKYLHATLYAHRINVRSIKQTTGIQNLDTGYYFQELIPYPSLNEQEEIAAYLDIKSSETLDIISSLTNQIIKLKEYRQSLIYEAVTGKIDVRDYKKVLS
ncbi:restriction endonuclease subunit S [Bacillus sp. Gen3]|nr:restriction endonuclease subunit S [Bacillus sp. Gen3]